MSPSLIKACSNFSDHGFEKFSRRQFPYCWRAEKIGPGAMLMPLDSAARWSSSQRAMQFACGQEFRRGHGYAKVDQAGLDQCANDFHHQAGHVELFGADRRTENFRLRRRRPTTRSHVETGFRTRLNQSAALQQLINLQ